MAVTAGAGIGGKGGSVRGPGDREEGTSGQGKSKKLNRRQRRRNRRRAVRAIQRRLRKRGFKIAVDGVMGPETKSALAAHRRGTKPKRWNRNHGKIGGRSRAGGGGNRGGGGGGRGRGGGGGGRSGGRSRGRSGPKLPSASKQARAATNQQYSAAISALRRQLDENEEQGEQNLTDIREWFGDVRGTAEEGRESNLAAGEAAEGDLEAAISAIIGAVGGSGSRAAGSIASSGASARAAMEATNRAQSNFDTSLGSVIGLQETDALRDETRFQADTEKGLRGQLTDLLKERGFAYQTNLQAARDANLSRRAAIQNMQIAGSMAGLDQALKMASLGAANRRNQIMDLQIADFIKTSAGGSAVPGFGELDPGQRAGLEDRIRALLTGKRGGFIMAPQKAYNQAGSALRRIGYDPRKSGAVDSFRDSIIKDILRRTQSLGDWRRIRLGREGIPIAPGGRIGRNAI